MDFHTLTKKHSHTLCQIAKRGLVSSFFEPLLTMRELEALRLIDLVQADEYDSGLGYQLTHAGKVLAPLPAGTEYCIGDSAIVLRHVPQSEPDCSEALKKAEQELVELRAKLEHLNNVLDARDAEIGRSNERIRTLDAARAANTRLYDAVNEKNQVITNLQRTVDDYAQRNKVNLQVIKNLEHTAETYRKERDAAREVAEGRWQNGKRLNDQLQAGAIEHNRLVDKVGRLQVQLKGFGREPMQVFRFKHGDTPGLFLKVGEAICCDNVCTDKKIVVYQTEEGELFWRDLADFDENFEVLP